MDYSGPMDTTGLSFVNAHELPVRTVKKPTFKEKMRQWGHHLTLLTIHSPSKNYIESLPDDVLKLVFPLLTVGNQSDAAKVCKKWRRLSAEECFINSELSKIIHTEISRLRLIIVKDFYKPMTALTLTLSQTDVRWQNRFMYASEPDFLVDSHRIWNEVPKEKNTFAPFPDSCLTPELDKADLVIKIIFAFNLVEQRNFLSSKPTILTAEIHSVLVITESEKFKNVAKHLPEFITNKKKLEDYRIVSTVHVK